MSSESNAYLGEVIQQQQRVDQELKRRMPVASPSRARALATPEEFASGAAARVRITGWWRWKTVVVPPNVYVVHTRRGRAEPVHVGLGVSFGFNPYRDAFLVIPAAMQTILINARCICAERQGILVQAYLQWIVDDVAAAYKKLDFSDADDPMRIVNVQLREQAEAAIKDKVATMEVNDVLSDKQPIIEELTARLRQVAEGTGLRIVTVAPAKGSVRARLRGAFATAYPAATCGSRSGTATTRSSASAGRGTRPNPAPARRSRRWRTGGRPPCVW